MRISRQRRTLARGALFLAALALALAVSVPAPGGARIKPRPLPAPGTGLPAIESGKPPPDFTYDVGEGARRLSEARGAPALVHFWDSWCEPCVDELPLLERLRREDPGLTIITISDEQPGVARTYLKEHALGLPLSEDVPREIFKLYTVQAIPVSVLVRADGTVGYVAVGAMDWAELSGALAVVRRP